MQLLSRPWASRPGAADDQETTDETRLQQEALLPDRASSLGPPASSSSAGGRCSARVQHLLSLARLHPRRSVGMVGGLVFLGVLVWSLLRSFHPYTSLSAGAPSSVYELPSDVGSVWQRWTTLRNPTATPDDLYVPPCPSILIAPSHAPLPPLYCPATFLPLVDYANLRVPHPLRLDWLAQDRELTGEEVRRALADDAATHSPDGARAARARESALRRPHIHLDATHPLAASPPASLAQPVAHRRLYDVFLFNSELEWLDIRLQELWPVVDVFLLIESVETFSGQPKALYYEQHKLRYQHYWPKIMHVRLEKKPTPSYGELEREEWQRLWPLDHARLQKLYGMREGDLLMVGDLDELPRATVLHQLKQCGGWEALPGKKPGQISLAGDYFQYSYEFPTAPQQAAWIHPNLHVYRHDLPLDKDAMRTGWTGSAEGGPYVFEAAWHCSSCFPTLRHYGNKLESFSHQGYNRPEMKASEYLRAKMADGGDLFTEGKRARQMVRPKSLPAVVWQHPQCYAHLISRAVGIEEGRPNWWQKP